MSNKRKQPAKGKPGKAKGRYARQRRVPWFPLIGAAVVLVVAFLVVRSLELGAPGERIAVTGVGQHVSEGQPVQYSSVPPVGGPHWPAPAGWGASSVQIPDERAVHNLEHGGIVVGYNGISADDLTKLKAVITGYPRDQFNEIKIVLQPYDKIAPGSIALTAWGWRQLLPAYDVVALRAFLDGHMNRCCESVP